MSYLEDFTETLQRAKDHPFGWFLAWAGHQPVMAMYTGGEIFPKFSLNVPVEYQVALAFPPDPAVKNLTHIREMLRSGHYSIGRRYMEKILEVFDTNRTSDTHDSDSVSGGVHDTGVDVVDDTPADN